MENFVFNYEFDNDGNINLDEYRFPYDEKSAQLTSNNRRSSNNGSSPSTASMLFSPLNADSDQRAVPVEVAMMDSVFADLNAIWHASELAIRSPSSFTFAASADDSINQISKLRSDLRSVNHSNIPTYIKSNKSSFVDTASYTQTDQDQVNFSPSSFNKKTSETGNVHNFNDHRSLSPAMERGSTLSRTGSVGRTAAVKRPTTLINNKSGAGALDEMTFQEAFGAVTQIQIYSSRELEQVMSRITSQLASNADEWERRVDALRQLRALLIAGGAVHDNFLLLLRDQEVHFQNVIADLRSQVVREACITIAFLCQELRNRVATFVENVLAQLFALAQNSAKIISSSGVVALRFVFRFVHSARLLPHLFHALNSKSTIIRRALSEILELTLTDWPTHALEKHLTALRDAVRNGVSDADQETRVLARRAFLSFERHFPEQGDALFQCLEPSKRKMLEKERDSNEVFDSATKNGVLKAAVQVQPQRRQEDYVGGSSGFPRSISDHQALRQDSTSSSSTARRPYTITKTHQQVQQQRQKTAATTKVSQSQPASRNHSPTRNTQVSSHGSSSTSGTGGTDSRSGTSRSRIPRSQGASRDGSPSRLSIGSGTSANETAGYGVKRSGSLLQRNSVGRSSLRSTRGSQSSNSGPRSFSTDSESEKYISTALSGKLSFKRHESFESDDASETSSLCSDTSYRSFVGSTNMADILVSLNSNNWVERKDGLLSLQNYLKSRQALNGTELRKVTEVFTKMFNDSHNKVISLFLETVQDLVSLHSGELVDWLYILLIKLLTKLGNENLTSQQMRIQRTLDTVKDSFSPSTQFYYMCRFVSDPTQTPNLKVRVALLQFTSSLLSMMRSDDLNNCKEARLAVTKFITWAMEPKSVDVRKNASVLLISMFDLNSSVFSSILQHVPSSFQDAAYRILRNHIGQTQQDKASIASNSGKEATAPSSVTASNASASSKISPEEIQSCIRQTTEEIQNLYDPSQYESSSGYSSGRSTKDTIPQQMSHRNSKTPNANSGADKFLRPRRILLEASTLDASSGNHSISGNTSRTAHINSTSTDSGIQNSYPDLHGDIVEARPRALFQNASVYMHNQRRDMPCAYAFKEENNEDLTPEDLMVEILQELSNHNERHEERKASMLRIIKMLRERSVEALEEHFKSILLILLETLGDNRGEIRALSLRVLQELLQWQPDRFCDFTELTILKILESHRDEEKPVVRAAEDCAMVLASALPSAQILRVLSPIVTSAEFMTNLTAIKIMTQVIQVHHAAALEALLTEVVPGLVRSCEHQESTVRKAAIFCLVALHAKVGEVLWSYLKGLNNSKIRLLNLYISRAKDSSDGFTASGMTSPTNC